MTWLTSVRSALTNEIRHEPLAAPDLVPEHPFRLPSKLAGAQGVRVPRDSPHAQYMHPARVLHATLTSFIGIALVGLLSQYGERFGFVDSPLLIGSMGATAVLLFAAPTAPLSQPRNLIMGHTLSAVVGVLVRRIFLSLPALQWLAAALAVSLSICLMALTRSLHPPGGATALIAVIGSPSRMLSGFAYILTVCLSVAVMLLTTLFTGNVLRCTCYPQYWL